MKSMDVKRVLVVDDYPDSARSVKDHLRKEFEVDLYFDSQKALEAILSNDYDCVVSDGEMPGLSGPELMKEVLAKKPRMDGRFVFVTGSPFNVMRDLQDIGQAKVLFKPAYKSDLLEAVNKAASV